MSPLAFEFAKTASGYIAGIGLPVLGTVLAFLITRAIVQAARGREALAEVTRALAVLVAQATDDRDTMREMRRDHDQTAKNVSDLPAETAALRECVDNHLRWAEQQRQELREDARRSREAS